MSNNEQAPPAEQTELTVGQLLKQEREQRKLTLEHVAKQLNLKVEVLQSLEADQPDKAILPTFMRGYVRAYARFLKMPEQQLLSRFEQVHQVKSTPVKAMKTFSNRQAKQQTETRFMWLTYVIVAILLASLAAWLWQGARDFTSTTATTEPIVSVVVDADSSAVPQTELMPAIEQTATVSAVDSAASAAEASALVLPPQAVLTSEEAAIVLPEPTEVAESSSESFGDSNDSGLDRLKMTFNDNCWIDVLDANGERIAYGTKQSGYVMELNARGPFTITLGNPSVVAIDINQKPFDMSGFPGGRVAKFTLAGQDE
ncbi:RodZ domain-containing protein [Alishewanella longhuensis]